MARLARLGRWLMVIAAAGVLPAFIMRCDKAALNFQRSLIQSMGADVGSLLISQISIDDGDAN